jgi:phosphohistidine phosphatase
MTKGNAPIRTLTLLRHAKSSWKNPALDDIERPLNKRGRRDADAMAQRLVEHGATFTAVFASPARRSRETLTRMLLALPAQDAIVTFDQVFYTFDSDMLIAALKKLDDDLQDVAIVGHNPALEDTIRWLTSDPVEKFPTAAGAQLTIALPHWKKLYAGCAKLMWLLTPEKSLTL